MDDKELELLENEEEITVDYLLTEIKKRTDKNQPNMLLAYMDFCRQNDIDLEDKKERKKYLPNPLLQLLTQWAIKTHVINDESGNIDEFL